MVNCQAELVRIGADVVRHLIEVIVRLTWHLRESGAVDQGSAVSARFAVATTEAVAAATLRRAVLTGRASPTARPVDVEPAPAVLHGMLEFASGEEGPEDEALEHLLSRDTTDTARFGLRGVGLRPPAVAAHSVRTGERVPAAEVVAVGSLTDVATRLDAGGTEDSGPIGSAAELALELSYGRTCSR